MKKKILGMLICIFLIATAVPLAESSKNITIEPKVPNTPEKSMAGNWTEIQKLFASDGEVLDKFGNCVSVDGDTALVGAMLDDDNGWDSGSAYIFIRTGTTWMQQAKLLALNGTSDEVFGWSVSLSDDIALIGVHGYEHHKGTAYVFIRAGTTWTQQAQLLAFDGEEYENFGGSVSLDGDTAIIGASTDDDNGYYSGSAYVFTRTGTTWTQQAKLLASDGAAWNGFGNSVSLDDNTALIGAYGDDDNGNGSGSAYVFTRTGTTWIQQVKLIATDGSTYDRFGYSLSLSGDTALIGAPESNSAYIFTLTGTTWTEQVKLIASNGAENDQFGHSVSLDANTALIGSPGDDDNGLFSGSAYIFTHSETTWIQQEKLIASDGASEDWFGESVSLGKDTALIGASYDDDNGNDSGSVYVFSKVDLIFSIAGGFGVKIKITNNGTTDAHDVPWQLHVGGGILGRINTTVNGTIDIPAGISKNVETKMLLGLGPITITVKVANEKKTTRGIQIFIFSIVKTPFPWIQ